MLFIFASDLHRQGDAGGTVPDDKIPVAPFDLPELVDPDFRDLPSGSRHEVLKERGAELIQEFVDGCHC